MSSSDPSLLLIAAVFMIAGIVKGVIGMGLPTVVIGLLATRVPPAQAVALVIVPALITNIWQTFVGPYLRDILRRLWPLMLCTCLGIWAGGGLMTGPYGVYGTLILGGLLMIYAALGLRSVRFHVRPDREKPVGAAVGLVTGLVAAMTGVQVIPSMPFMQAIGMEKDELVQALGLFFTAATAALAFNLSDAGLLTVAIAVPGAVALAAAFAGMMIGQVLRSRMNEATFRRWFFIFLLLLGFYLAVETYLRLA